MSDLYAPYYLSPPLYTKEHNMPDTTDNRYIPNGDAANVYEVHPVPVKGHPNAHSVGRANSKGARNNHVYETFETATYVANALNQHVAQEL